MRVPSKQTKMSFYIATFALAILLILPNVFSLVSSNFLIRTSGLVVYPGTARALHVEGNKVKDSAGNTVYLRGVGYWRFADDPTGGFPPQGRAYYDGFLIWDENAVRWHLKSIKNWGLNHIRIHTTADWWIEDTVTVTDTWLGRTYTGSYRNNLKRFVEIANEEGVYVLFDLWGLVNNRIVYDNNWGGAPGLPYPPYLDMAQAYVDMATAIFASEQDFINWWGDVANQLKAYPNVIFELYNEPNVGFITKSATVKPYRDKWFNVQQATVNKIRSVGATNLIVITWFQNINPDVGWEWGWTGDLTWIEKYPMTDPLNNLIYTYHTYRTYNLNKWHDAYNYNACKNILINCRVQEFAAKVPLVNSEIGANMWTDDRTKNPDSGLTERGEELAYGGNSFKIANEWGMGYSAWDWEVIDQWYLISQDTGFPDPSPWGQVLIDAVMSAS